MKLAMGRAVKDVDVSRPEFVDITELPSEAKELATHLFDAVLAGKQWSFDRLVATNANVTLLAMQILASELNNHRVAQKQILLGAMDWEDLAVQHSQDFSRWMQSFLRWCMLARVATRGMHIEDLVVVHHAAPNDLTFGTDVVTAPPLVYVMHATETDLMICKGCIASGSALVALLGGKDNTQFTQNYRMSPGIVPEAQFGKRWGYTEYPDEQARRQSAAAKRQNQMKANRVKHGLTEDYFTVCEKLLIAGGKRLNIESGLAMNTALTMIRSAVAHQAANLATQQLAKIAVRHGVDMTMLTTTPTVAGDETPVVTHLLATRAKAEQYFCGVSAFAMIRPYVQYARTTIPPLLLDVAEERAGNVNMLVPLQKLAAYEDASALASLPSRVPGFAWDYRDVIKLCGVHTFADQPIVGREDVYVHGKQTITVDEYASLLATAKAADEVNGTTTQAQEVMAKWCQGIQLRLKDGWTAVVKNNEIDRLGLTFLPQVADRQRWPIEFNGHSQGLDYDLG